MTLFFKGGDTLPDLAQKKCFFEKYRNIQNERFLIQTLLSPSQFWVAEHIPNIIVAYKCDLGPVKLKKAEKNHEKWAFLLHFYRVKIW